jgi:hypothetical protein
MFKIEIGYKSEENKNSYYAFLAAGYEFKCIPGHSFSFDYWTTEIDEDHLLTNIHYLSIDNTVYINNEYTSDHLKMILSFLEKNRR